MSDRLDPLTRAQRLRRLLAYFVGTAAALGVHGAVEELVDLMDAIDEVPNE